MNPIVATETRKLWNRRLRYSMQSSSIFNVANSFTIIKSLVIKAK